MFVTSKYHRRETDQLISFYEDLKERSNNLLNKANERIRLIEDLYRQVFSERDTLAKNLEIMTHRRNEVFNSHEILRNKIFILEGDNDSLRKVNAKAADLIVLKNEKNRELMIENYQIESLKACLKENQEQITYQDEVIRDLKNKLELAYGQLHPEKKPRKKAAPKKSQKVTADGIRNIRRRKRSDS